MLWNNVTNSIVFRKENSLEGVSCLSLTRGFIQNDSDAYMKYLFQQHDFFDMILLLKGNMYRLFQEIINISFWNKQKSLLKRKKIIL